MIDVFETKLCYLREVHLESIVDQLYHVPYLVTVCLLDEYLGCFSEFFFCPCYGILVGSLDKGHNYAG